SVEAAGEPQKQAADDAQRTAYCQSHQGGRESLQRGCEHGSIHPQREEGRSDLRGRGKACAGRIGNDKPGFPDQDEYEGKPKPAWQGATTEGVRWHAARMDRRHCSAPRMKLNSVCRICKKSGVSRVVSWSRGRGSVECRATPNLPGCGSRPMTRSPRYAASSRSWVT